MPTPVRPARPAAREPAPAWQPDLDTRPLAERPAVAVALALYAAVWAWCAVRPLDRAEWALEQLLPAGWVTFLVLAWRKRLLRLSDASSLLVAVFLALHAVGARYGYEATPAGAWLAERAGAGAAGGPVRNPYDRLVHFAFGLCLGYVGQEVWLRFGRFTRFARAWAAVHAWVAVLAASALYEVLEWGAARLLAPGGLGSAFVGTQGDVWDAPADMGMAAAGSLAGLAGAELLRRGRSALQRAAGVYRDVVERRRNTARPSGASRHGARIRTSATG